MHVSLEFASVQFQFPDFASQKYFTITLIYILLSLKIF